MDFTWNDLLVHIIPHFHIPNEYKGNGDVRILQVIKGKRMNINMENVYEHKIW
jgi:hypothetical protein